MFYLRYGTVQGTGMIRLNPFVAHPQKTAQTRQIKLDEKETQGKKPWVFFAFMEQFLGEKQQGRDRGKRIKTAYVPEDYWWMKSEENKWI